MAIASSTGKPFCSIFIVQGGSIYLVVFGSFYLTGDIKLLNRIRENTQIKGNTFLGVFIYIISVKKSARSPPSLRFRLSKKSKWRFEK
jgi:hypothetical protein